jgi:hypothetical protein
MTRRLAPLAIVLGLALGAAPAIASGTVHVKSGTYRGTLAAPRTDITVSLTVARGKLSKARMSNVPFYCSSGGQPIPVKFKPSKISRTTGAFSTTAKYVITSGHFKGKVGERLKMSGRFTSHGTVSGTVKTSFVLNAPSCEGKTRFSASK